MYSSTPGPQDSPHRIGLGSGTGPLDYGSRDPVPDPRDTSTLEREDEKYKTYSPPIPHLLQVQQALALRNRIVYW